MTESATRLLVVDDEPDLRTLYELTLLREGYEVESAETVAQARELLAGKRYAALITDMRLPDGSGLDLLADCDAQGRSERVIVITAYGSAENAVEALKAGAYDYLTKPVDLRQFRSTVASALGRMPAVVSAGTPVPALAPAARGSSHRAGSRASSSSSDEVFALERIAGGSAAMQQVRSLVKKVARSAAPVLVRGESGTGKELVARAIHACSVRAAGPFVAVNCGAIPEALLESEFFGYRKGAFTGAQEDRAGFFQAAHGGTLFLDEVAELPLAMQSKLLRVIQERAVRPVGAVSETPVQVRLLSATHRDLGEEVAAGRFRQDLFYRLNVIQIVVPPLRERMADLPQLCSVLLERIAHDAGVSPVPQIEPAALASLQAHAFPGNVRELENILHRALALTGAECIRAEDLALDAAAPDTLAGSLMGGLSDAALPSNEPAPSGATSGALPRDLVAYLDEMERDILLKALERHRFNRTAAGASLGLTLRQMRYRMARLKVLGEEEAR
jgi:two-component system, NtrC family, response regulator PilR